MNSLRATRDIRKVALWLGHSSLRSTEIYLRADPTEKLNTIEAALPPNLRRGVFQVEDRLRPERPRTGQGVTFTESQP